jgi:DNA-binding MarR family transcriptional regulator
MYLSSGTGKNKVRVDSNAYRVHLFFKYLVREWIRHPSRRTLSLEISGLHDSGLLILQTIDEKGPLSISELGRELFLDPSTVNRQVRPLRNEGLLEPQHGTVGRTTQLRLTPEGDAVLARMEIGWISHWQRVMKKLPADDRQLLAQLLETFRDAMMKDMEEHAADGV